MAFTDKTLTCVECGSPFTFSADDQAYHQERGFTNEPRRCPRCRTAQRAARSSGSSYSSGAYGGQREMFSAVCAACGKETQVPFQPRGDRPVYCSDCFRSRQGGSGSGRGGRGGSDRRW